MFVGLNSTSLIHSERELTVRLVSLR